MRNDFWPQFREYVNSKEVGHKFRRPEFLLFANAHDTPHGTVDTNRNLLVRSGFLKIVGRGTYEVQGRIPNGTTTTELHELAYGSKLTYLEKVVARKHREKVQAEREAFMLELKTKNAAIVLEARAKPCLDCNLPLPDYVKVFSYRQPQDKYQGISAFISAPTEKLLAELTKCDLICLNCNATRIHNDKHSFVTS